MDGCKTKSQKIVVRYRGAVATNDEEKRSTASTRNGTIRQSVKLKTAVFKRLLTTVVQKTGSQLSVVRAALTLLKDRKAMRWRLWRATRS